MEIIWNPANRKDKSILLYGYAAERGEILNQEIDYKITFKSDWYLAYRKTGRRYVLLDNFRSLTEAKEKCLTNLRLRGEHGK